MTYSALAPIYDRVMSHVRYSEWLALIRKICTRYACRANPSVYELGAGTGTLGALLGRAGFPYAGSDLSFNMCRVARHHGHSPVVADARSIAVKGPYEMVLFLYDGINYLETAADYCMLFESVYRILADGGLFLFDITTIANSRRYFTDFRDSEELDDCYYTRHSYFDERSLVQHNDFIIHLRSADDPSCYDRFTEHHQQWVHAPQTIQEWIPSHLFDTLGIWNGYTFRRYNDQSTRIHFLLRKKPLGEQS